MPTTQYEKVHDDGYIYIHTDVTDNKGNLLSKTTIMKSGQAPYPKTIKERWGVASTTTEKFIIIEELLNLK